MWMVYAVMYMAFVGQVAVFTFRIFERDEEQLRQTCIRRYGFYMGDAD